MSNRNKENIAGIIRNTLITRHGYKTEGDYVRKEISDNYGIGFFHDNTNTLCICVYHKEGTQFSAQQKSAIFNVLARPEFTASYYDATLGESTDGRSEIWSSLKINSFDGYDDEGIADWVVKLFEHLVTTMNLLLVS